MFELLNTLGFKLVLGKLAGLVAQKWQYMHLRANEKLFYNSDA
jgi:hypothetical protein